LFVTLSAVGFVNLCQWNAMVASQACNDSGNRVWEDLRM